MVYKHFRTLPQVYSIEARPDGRVNIWLFRQVDTYVSADGMREYDVDVRVIHGVENIKNLEAGGRAHWSAWWSIAEIPDE